MTNESGSIQYRKAKEYLLSRLIRCSAGITIDSLVKEYSLEGYSEEDVRNMILALQEEEGLLLSDYGKTVILPWETIMSCLRRDVERLSSDYEYTMPILGYAPELETIARNRTIVERLIRAAKNPASPEVFELLKEVLGKGNQSWITGVALNAIDNADFLDSEAKEFLKSFAK